MGLDGCFYLLDLVQERDTETPRYLLTCLSDLDLQRFTEDSCFALFAGVALSSGCASRPNFRAGFSEDHSHQSSRWL
jgi:hypothetical protein